MKIWFPKYGPGELLIKKRDALSIISSLIIGFLAGLCGSYLLKNHFWLLTIAVFGIVSILLCVGGAVDIVLSRSTADEPPTATIRENVPQLTSQWAYQTRKTIRSPAVIDSPSAETCDVLTPDPFAMNDNVWFNDNSLKGVAPAFVDRQPDGEELVTKVVSETTDTVYAAPTADDAAVSTYDQSPIDERMVATEDGFRS
jgi:hypothetical protein